MLNPIFQNCIPEHKHIQNMDPRPSLRAEYGGVPSCDFSNMAPYYEIDEVSKFARRLSRSPSNTDRMFRLWAYGCDTSLLLGSVVKHSACVDKSSLSLTTRIRIEQLARL